MKVVILAGGLGTRLSEETTVKPKPMVEIGAHPILWHVMNIYAAHGFKEFVVALGYKGEVIKHYFLNFYHYHCDLEVDLRRGCVKAVNGNPPDWSIQLVDTGQQTLTGGRLHRLRERLTDQTFMLTYGDGLGNIDIRALLKFHRAHGKVATVTAVRPVARFGGMTFEGKRVKSFKEKEQTDAGWINGGFFVFERGVFDYLDGDATILEGAPLERLAADGQLMGYQHKGFWQCMDTLREKNLLNDLWLSGRAPWLTPENR